MGLLRARDGSIVSVDDDHAGQLIASGDFTPVSAGDAGAPVDRERSGGVLGAIGAGATSIAAGATLGGSDYLFKGLLNQGDFERLRTDREEHPILSGAGQIAGTIAASVAAPGTLLGEMPLAIAGRTSLGAAQAARAGGGATALGRLVTAAGVEGALQNTGAYLSDTALGDRKLSAEGIAGAAGMGFGFGAAGGAVALGVERGTIAARRLFARVAHGGERAANAAEQAWRETYQSTIEAHDAAADVARAKLAEARAARESAGLARQQAAAGVAEARAAAPVVEAARTRAVALDSAIGKVEAQESSQGGLEALNRAVGLTPDGEATLAGALAAHDAAKLDLDEVLRRIEAPEVGEVGGSIHAVPMEEFGPAGGRGTRTQGALARAVAEAGGDVESVVAAAPGRGNPTRVLKRAVDDDASRAGLAIADGTPPPTKVPTYDAIKAHETAADDYLEGTVSARALRDRGYFEPPAKPGRPDLALEDVDPVRMGKARKAIADGQTDAVKLNLSPEGKITVTDGRHRLAAAIEADAPIKVKWSTGFEPAADDVLRGGAQQASELEAALRGTQEQLAAGGELGAIGAPARAEYAAGKAARTAETAERFRAAARADNYGGSKMAADELAARSEAMAQRAGIGARGRGYGVAGGGARRQGHPFALRELEVAHDAAVERAVAAVSPGERAAAEQEIAAIEEHMTAVGARPGAVEDVAALAPAITKYERKSAELVEALGADAPPAAQEAAKSFRAAEGTAERKTVDRTTRAIDDSVEHAARTGRDVTASDDYISWALARKDATDPIARRLAANAERAAPLAEAGARDAERMTAESAALDAANQQPGPGMGDMLAAARAAKGEAVAAAQRAKGAADAGAARARAVEAEAKIGAGRAQQAAKDVRARAEAARPAAAGPGPTSKLGQIAKAVAVAGEIGIPGVPHPKDIPLIGPLFDLYVKMRIAKATLGRFVGRVSATGDARAAAMAARTKDKIAHAVDRTLGLVADTAPKARLPIVASTVTLGRRIFDDGQPDAPAGSSAPALAAVRAREIATAASRPDLVSAHVRVQMAGVIDPDLIAAAEQHMMRQFAWLATVTPKPPADNPFSRRPWAPSPADAHDLAQRLAVIHDPAYALHVSTPATADTFRRAWPELAAMAKDRLLERLSDAKEPMSYNDRLRASRLFDLQIDNSLAPENIAILRAPSTMDDQPQPTPPMASAPDVSALFNPQETRKR